MHGTPPRPAPQVPIAPYLVALAVGDLVSRDLGARTRVWSEPAMVEAGAHEFAETAKFLEAGETGVRVGGWGNGGEMVGEGARGRRVGGWVRDEDSGSLEIRKCCVLRMAAGARMLEGGL